MQKRRTDMRFFIDTADVVQIREAAALGILDGVTTNPTWVNRAGREPKELYREICSLCEGDVSLEAVATEAGKIIEEARGLASIASNVVVKIPLTKEGIIAVGTLAKEGIKTNVTLVFSPLQALVAAKAGATYVSPFVGRLDMAGHIGMTLVEQTMKIFANYGFSTKVIVASIQSPLHVLEAALVGADICTIGFDTMMKLFDHPMTDIGIERFLEDWKQVKTAEKR
jgi:transaldolase